MTDKKGKRVRELLGRVGRGEHDNFGELFEDMVNTAKGIDTQGRDSIPVEEVKQYQQQNQQAIQELGGALKDLLQPPHSLVPLVDIDVDGEIPLATVSTIRGLVEVPVKREIVDQLKPGVTVKYSEKQHVIVDVADPIEVGRIGTVTRVVNQTTAVVTVMGQAYLVCLGTHHDEVKAGDEVAVDTAYSVVLANFGQPDTFSQDHNIKTVWEDIKGQEEAIQDIMDNLVMPHQYPDLFDLHNISAARGILITGSPGNGKTMIAEAIYTHLTKDAKEGDKTGYFFVSGSFFLRKFVGEGPEALRLVFEWARRFAVETTRRAIFVIDEAESAFQARGSGKSSDANDALVTTLLKETNDFGDNNPILILITNKPELLDDAVTRDGRMDLKVHIKRPNRKATQAIVTHYLKNKPLVEGLEVDEAIAKAVEAIYDPQKVVFDVAVFNGEKREETTINFHHVISGAMIKGMIVQASKYAIRRHVDDTENEPKELTLDDITRAVAKKFEENLNLGHEYAVKEFQDHLEGDVLGIKPRVMKQLQ